MKRILAIALGAVVVSAGLMVTSGVTASAVEYRHREGTARCDITSGLHRGSFAKLAVDFRISPENRVHVQSFTVTGQYVTNGTSRRVVKPLARVNVEIWNYTHTAKYVTKTATNTYSFRQTDSQFDPPLGELIGGMQVVAGVDMIMGGKHCTLVTRYRV
jgi:hypothetical protein